MIKTFCLSNVWITCFEGETPPADPPTLPKTFTQDQLNTALAEDRRKHQETVGSLTTELEALKKRSGLSTEERTALEGRVEELNTQLLTKDELSAREKAKLEKQLKTENENLTGERDTWKNRYQNSTIDREITDAANLNEPEAVNAKQVLNELRAQSRLVEILDEEGKSTGRFETKIKVETKDKNDQPVTLDLSPRDAVKQLSENPNYFNLFKGEGTGGVGIHSKPGSNKETSIKELAKDPKAYIKARRAGEVTL